MHHAITERPDCSIRTPVDARERERGVRAVVLLTTAMMVVEVVVGYLTGSMALLADGWHMATHVAALGLASAAYALSRRFAAHRAFAFGTGKIQALGGYTSAVALGLVAVMMMAEAASRLLQPTPIDFSGSLPVAVLGLVVNLASYRLLHGAGHEQAHGHDEHEHDHAHGHADDHEHEHEAHDHEHGHHEHGHHQHGHHQHGHHQHGHHDHNHRAAVLHVAADALTSVLAILALLAGRYLGVTWLDPLMGVVGGVVILKWGVSLCKHAAFDLLDVDLSSSLEDGIRSTLERIDDVRVSDLHVWSLGRGDRGCIVSLVSSSPRECSFYKQRLGGFGLAHLTIEVTRCTEGHALTGPSAAAVAR